MKVLIADKFSEAHLDRLRQLGCDVTYNAALRTHKWNKKEFSKADGVFGKTLGVVGVGQIGREVIKRAHAFGLQVLAWSRSLNLPKAKELEVEYCPDLDLLFRRADIVSL